ncbi:hypothetical protein [Microlunatus sp. GCM10028923]|uniref:hypothetical protein n=1 Tax=Microlunatus sp. GCM10028923 TaxID=3273400 RepID=UPI00360AEE5A
MSEPQGALASLPTRLPPFSSAAVLALTATPWLQKVYETSEVDVNQTYTLWGMLATVNHSLLFALVLAIGILLAFVVVGVLAPPDQLLARSVLGWLAAVAAAGIIVFADNGHIPGAGVIITLIVCVITAAVTSFAPLLQRFQAPTGT